MRKSHYYTVLIAAQPRTHSSIDALEDTVTLTKTTEVGRFSHEEHVPVVFIVAPVSMSVMWLLILVKILVTVIDYDSLELRMDDLLELTLNGLIVTVCVIGLTHTSAVIYFRKKWSKCDAI